jgi:hypothetical protein
VGKRSRWRRRWCSAATSQNLMVPENLMVKLTVNLTGLATEHRPQWMQPSVGVATSGGGSGPLATVSAGSGSWPLVPKQDGKASANACRRSATATNRNLREGLSV